jgi:hypothetical protein
MAKNKTTKTICALSLHPLRPTFANFSLLLCHRQVIEIICRFQQREREREYTARELATLKRMKNERERARHCGGKQCTSDVVLSLLPFIKLIPFSSTSSLRFLSRPRLLFAAAAAAAAFAVGRFAGSWARSSPLFGADPRLCDPKVGCTPVQLAAKRLTPLAAGRKHAFASVQEAWNATVSGLDLIDVVDRVIGEKNLKCVLNLGKSLVFSSSSSSSSPSSPPSPSSPSSSPSSSFSSPSSSSSSSPPFSCSVFEAPFLWAFSASF